MAIVTNEYVAYDTTEHFYYLTPAGFVEYTGKSHIINMWKDAKWRLKNMGRLFHDDYTWSVFNYKDNRYRNLDHIEYAIFKNEHGEREAIIRGLTMFGMAADDSDLDVRIMAGEAEITEAIRKPLRKAGLYFRGSFSGYIEEDEWRVGY